MKSTLALSSFRIAAVVCTVLLSCGRSDIDELLVEGGPGDDDFGDEGSGRGGANGNGGGDPGHGGSSVGRGGTFGGAVSTGGGGNAVNGGAAGASTKGGAGGASTNGGAGGASTAGTPGGGVGAAGGSEPRGGTSGMGGASGSGGAPVGGSAGQTSGFIRCGELLCDPRGSVCCRGGGEFACGATLDDCPRIGLACTGASTCPQGLVCCLRFARATCEATCEPGDPGPGRGFRLCDSSMECGPEQTCISGPRGLTWCADNFP